MKTISMVLFVLFAVSGCGSGDSLTPSAKNSPPKTQVPPAPLVLPILLPQERVEKLFGGQQALQIVQQATTVEAFRVDGDLHKENKGKAIDGYEILSGPVAVSPEHAGQLAKILSDPDIYDWERAKTCAILPGVAIRFTSENGSIDVLLCFACDILEFFQNGKRVGVEDFDKARGPLLALVKQLFPEDAEIQALPAKGK